LEDLTGAIELVAFPDCYERCAEVWRADAIVEVVGRLERRGEVLQIVCEAATTELTIASPLARERRTIDLRLPASPDVWADIQVMHRLDAALRRHEGDDELVLRVARSRRVDWGPLLAAELGEIVGVERVAVREATAARLAS
jgi:hypothetical protein